MNIDQIEQEIKQVVKRDTKFKPGQSGNPGGRPKTKIWRAALMSMTTREDIEDMARALIDKCKNGDIPAIKEFADRIDGKAIQEITGKDGDQLQSVIILPAVREE